MDKLFDNEFVDSLSVMLFLIGDHSVRLVCQYGVGPKDDAVLIKQTYESK
ncbi:MAG: hypothetical protein K0S24_2124 [Sphingobacterium sp.]|jgi:hypothetical protein|nr:hypothetical protein [Sphingobacterium sp.]